MNLPGYDGRWTQANALVDHQLARRTAEHKKVVLDSILEVVRTVTMARPKRDIVSWDKSLEGCVKDLYVAVIEAVVTIVQFLLQKVEKIDLSKRGELVTAQRNESLR